MSIRLGLSLLFPCGEQASHSKPRFLLCSPFETPARLSIASQDAVRAYLFQRDYFPFHISKTAVRSNNTIPNWCLGKCSISLEKKKIERKTAETIRKKNEKNLVLYPQISAPELLIPLDKHSYFCLKHN